LAQRLLNWATPVQRTGICIEKRKQCEVESNAYWQPNWTITQSQNQEQIGSEDCDSQKRQKFRLAIAVKDQACDNQQLYLKCSKRREIVGPKYDYDEYAELPRCESHAAPLVIAENLSIQPWGGRRDELFTAVPWSGTGGTAENILHFAF
jgi:hypothetical protein